MGCTYRYISQAEIFQEFTIKDDLVGFQVNLTVLLDCLNIFGGSTLPGYKHRKLKKCTYCINVFIQYDVVAGVSTALRMCYVGYGYPLTLFLEEGGVVTVCKINTQEPEEPIDFEFCSSNVTNKVCLCIRLFTYHAQSPTSLFNLIIYYLSSLLLSSDPYLRTRQSHPVLSGSTGTLLSQ